MSSKLSAVLEPYREQKGALIPVLQETQEKFGYLPEAAISEIAKFLGLSQSMVYGVASFYAQFRFEPQGKHLIKVCQGTACHVRGAARILDEVEKQLGIKPRETTRDMECSLETIACFGSCALAPVMVVDEKVYGRTTPARVREILAKHNEPRGA